jgi:hypothetical protein
MKELHGHNEVSDANLKDPSHDKEHTLDQLSDEEKQKIEALAKEIIDGRALYNRNEPLLLSNNINTIIGNDRQNIITERKTAAVSLFLRYLFLEISNSSLNDHERIELLSRINSNLFSYSPNLLNEVGIDELFLLSSRLNRDPILRGWIGQRVVGEIVYELNFAKEELFEDIVERVTKQSLDEQLDVIRQCTTLGANAAAQGWADRAFDKIQKMLEEINEHSESPFISYAIQHAQARLDIENEWPSMGIVTYSGNDAAGRLPEEMGREIVESDILFRNTVEPLGVPPERNLRLIKIARDAIGAFDRTLMPQIIGIGPIEKIDIEHASAQSFEQLNVASNGFDRWDDFDNIQRLKLLLFTRQQLMSWEPSQKTLSNLLEVLGNIANVETTIKEEELRIQENVESACEQISREFIETVRVFIEKIRQENSITDVSLKFHDIAHALNPENELSLERRYKEASRACLYASTLLENKSLPENISLELAHLAELEDSVRDALISEHDARRTELFESPYLNALRERHTQLITQVSTTINAHSKAIRTAYTEALGKLKDSLEIPRTPITFSRVDDVLTCTYMHPIRTSNNESSLLFQHFMHPHFKSFVSEDLNLNLDEVSLRSQMFLLRALSTYNHERYANFVQTIRSYRGNRILLAETFLALEQDSGFAEQIERRVRENKYESIDEELVHFGEIAHAIDRVETYLNNTFKHITERKPDVIQTLRSRILERARRRLIDTDIGKALKQNSVETELFVSTFKSLIQHGEHIDLRDIQDVSFESSFIKDLSEEDISLMRAIYAQNYADTPELQQALLKKFDEIVNKERNLTNTGYPTNRFYTLKHKGRVVAFCRFEDGANNETYFGSFNVDPAYQHNALGQVFLDEAIKIESQWSTIIAECDITSPITMHYIEMGFIGEEYYEYAGAPVLKIRYQPNVPGFGAHMPREEIVRQRKNNGEETLKRKTFIHSTNNPKELPWTYLDEGEKLTRFFKSGDKYYAVFEPILEKQSAIIV